MEVANTLAYYSLDLNHASGVPLETALKDKAPILAHKYCTRLANYNLELNYDCKMFYSKGGLYNKTFTAVIKYCINLECLPLPITSTLV